LPIHLHDIIKLIKTITEHHDVYIHMHFINCR
jgi:hypothetical protein